VGVGHSGESGGALLKAPRSVITIDEVLFMEDFMKKYGD